MYSAVSLTLADSVSFLRWCEGHFRAEGMEFEANMAGNKADALGLLGSGTVALSKHEQAAPVIEQAMKAMEAVRDALGAVKPGREAVAERQYVTPSLDDDLFTPLGEGVGEPRL